MLHPILPTSVVENIRGAFSLKKKTKNKTKQKKKQTKKTDTFLEPYKASAIHYHVLRGLFWRGWKISQTASNSSDGVFKSAQKHLLKGHTPKPSAR